jgi:hypothetical protein
MESARPPLLPSKKIKRGARSMVQMKTMSRSINPDPWMSLRSRAVVGEGEGLVYIFKFRVYQLHNKPLSIFNLL